MHRALLILLAFSATSVRAEGWRPASEPPAQSGSFRHRRSKLTRKLGSHHHSAADVVVNAGAGASVEGKFAYGKTSKDLEDEEVSLWLRTGTAWKRIGSARTNDDGRARFQVPGSLLRRPGAHPFVLVVHGDDSRARGTIWAVARGKRAVIFDIDGTLTPGDREIVDYAVTGDSVAMRPDADALARHWARRGGMPIYLTGRPYLFNAATRQWLERHGFPPGPVITVDSVRQSLPSKGGAGSFKRSWLESTIGSTGLEVVAAYGNAKTDICAFARAGIAPTRTFIIGSNGGHRCKGFAKPNAVSDWSSHLRQLSAPQR